MTQTEFDLLIIISVAGGIVLGYLCALPRQITRKK